MKLTEKTDHNNVERPWSMYLKMYTILTKSFSHTYSCKVGL